MQILPTGMNSILARIASINQKMGAINQWGQNPNAYKTSGNTTATYGKSFSNSSISNSIDKAKHATFSEVFAQKVAASQMPFIKKITSHAKLSPLLSQSSTAIKTKIGAIILEASKKYKVNPNLIKAIIQQESNFNPKALSKSGAQGLMQLMPKTAKSLGVSNSYDPRQNIMGGTKFISQLLNRFNDKELALAAYNAGPSRVAKLGKVPPFKETQHYVTRVQQLESKFSNIAAKAYAKIN